MTIEAATTDIKDAFFIMMLDHFTFVMALVAGPFRTTRWMALTAFPIGRAMIHWKTMLESRPTPRRGIVTLGALPFEMI